MPVSENDFRQALSCFASGVNVVTTKDAAGEHFGITVSAFCSVSLDPPLVLICIEKQTASHHAFLESGAFVVNILDESHAFLSEQFATPLGDKFENIDLREGLDGIPVLNAAIANLECRTKMVHDGGDHSIIVGEVESSSVKDGEPLVYFQGEYRTLAK